MNWVISFTAPYFVNPTNLNWGGKYGWFWFVGCFAGAGFSWLCIPETKDRMLEEIDEMFAKRVPTRKFKTFVTTCLENVVVEEKDGVRILHSERVENVLVA
jgi:MFS transporter, SP family, sugar:H+ symporter